MSISETWVIRSPQFISERFKPMMMSDPKPGPEEGEKNGEGEGESSGDPPSDKPEQESAAKPVEEKKPVATQKPAPDEDPRKNWNRASRELRPSQGRGYQTR